MTESAPEQYVPDLTGVSVMLAAPCMTGLYDSRFLKSLHRTIKEIERFGGKVDMAEVLYCADIALARNRILGVFYRSNHTHMMLIDADMGWNEQDVVRLIIQKKDLIGAAGPKKMYPISFAANTTDEFGNPVPTNLNTATGIVEVNEVGMAFMLVSRECVEKMIESYQNLAFFSDEACLELDYALFDPMIVGETPRRRLSEDYSFCRRWREIGGKVELIADIRLTHTGMHTFSGALIDLFMQPTRQIVLEPEALHGEEERRAS